MTDVLESNYLGVVERLGVLDTSGVLVEAVPRFRTRTFAQSLRDKFKTRALNSVEYHTSRP